MIGFLKLKFRQIQKDRKRLLQKKLKLLKELEQALKPIIRYDDGEQIIASLRLDRPGQLRKWP